jgi:DNA-binding response OmpR family regulator
MLTALLIEDDYDLANTVIDYLSLENIECDHASNGIAGLALIQKNRYDIVLLDLNLPRLDGLRVCEALRKKGTDVPVLMLTARDQLKDKIAGFNAGTDDYLVKPFEMEELVVRVHALSRRRSGQVQLLKCGDLTMNLSQKKVTRNEQILKLSPTTWLLLEALLRASPNPVSRSDLERVIWGDEVPDSNSLKVHLFNLRKTIDNGVSKPLIHTIAGHGFALKEIL